MKKQNPQPEAMSPQSVAPQPKKGFGVAASPFNGVKIELGVALLLGFVLWLAADSITTSITAQLLLLVSYGLISAFWLILRTRRVLQQWEARQRQEQNQSIKPDSGQITHQYGSSGE